MLLLLSISGSSRIDQQLGKNVAMNLVAELFNKVPYTMFPYDAIQVKEFNPHMPCQVCLNPYVCVCVGILCSVAATLSILFLATPVTQTHTHRKS